MSTFESSSFSDIAALDAEHGMQTYGRLPVAFVRGEGTKLWDSEGNEYLDFLGGLAVTALGHAHPAVADAIADQARTLLHVSNLYFNEWQPQVAARLDALHGGDGKVFFANSGAEANECAIKLARRYGQANGGPDRFHVLSAWGSFHGRTLTTLAATGQPQKQETFQPLPEGFRQVVFADLDALAAAMDERVCAVMLEPIQGEGGVQPSPPGYLEGVRALCDEREALLIIDEVQTGLGRTGKWFGYQHAHERAARHRHHGQGARQRRAHRRVLGAHRGGGGVQARRPRHHLRRAAAGGTRRDDGARRDGRGRRARAARRGPASVLTKALLDVAGVAEVRGRRPADRRRARRGDRRRSQWRGRASTPGWSSTRSRPPRCGSRRRCS